MINLMPDEAKKQLRAARVNVLLVRYMFIIIIAGAFLGASLVVSMATLRITQASAEQTIEANSTKAQVYSETKAQVDALSSQLSTVKPILDQEVLYSGILVKLGQLMPTGTVINQLTIGSTSLGSPMTLKVYAKTNDDAVALREKFQTAPILTNVSFQEITAANTEVAGYPVSITMTFTMNRTAGK